MALSQLSQDENLALRDRLLALRGQIPKEKFYEGCDRRATEFVEKDPFAFLIGCCLDRGSPSEVIWSIPLWLKEKLGHLDPYKIANMDEEKLQEVIECLPKKPRYKNDTPKTIKCLAILIVKRFHGDARKIWKSLSAKEIAAVLKEIHGVGDGIANLAVQQIKRVYGRECPNLDPDELDIKADVHTRRVLYRLGAAERETNSHAIRAARNLYPGRPGALDPALWHIGREWCHKHPPNCAACPMNDLCARQGVGWQN